MRNKKLIYFTILLISLLAISSVSASEDIDTINELTTGNIGEKLVLSDEISDVENDNGGITPVKDTLQANDIGEDTLQATRDITIPTTEINLTGEEGMQANVSFNILKNSRRSSTGNLTLFGSTHYISFWEENTSFLYRNISVTSGAHVITYKDSTGTYVGTIIINIVPKNATYFDAKDKTIYKNEDEVYLGLLKDSNNNLITDKFIQIQINDDYYDSYINSDGKIYVKNEYLKIGKNKILLKFEEDGDYNSSTKTITVTKKDKFTIKAPNYNSFYTSKKKLKITASQKVKMKIVFKNKKTKKTKTYYVTGTTNYKIPVGCGKYTVTITSANPYYSSNKCIINVTVNKYTTFKHGKYSINVHYKTMKKIQNAYLKQIEDWKGISKKIKGKYYTWKQPIYKTIKVKKTGYKYKYVKYSEGYYYDEGSEYEYYKVKAPKGYKYCGIYTKWSNNYNHVINYYKFKKKTTYYTTKDVISRYKKHKEPVYKTVEYDGLMGSCYFSIGNFYKTYYYRNINKYFKV